MTPSDPPRTLLSQHKDYLTEKAGSEALAEKKRLLKALQVAYDREDGLLEVAKIDAQDASDLDEKADL